MKLNLYIGGIKADLSDESLVSFIYQMDDIEKPTIIRNTYSQSLTLPATPRNNAIFGAYSRNDKRMSTNSFNALKRADFRIINERGEVVESGYIKLDKTIRKRGAEGYTVTLFGGLGNFIYSLAYDEAGEKRTLASLRYLPTGNKDAELNFDIDRNAVAQAWARMGSADGTSKWDIINFAPCINPQPSDFDTDKVVIDATNNGSQFPASVTEGGTVYGNKGGYLLAKLGKDYTEAQMLDYRSYLQRPVLSVKAVLDAICKAENNGGYSVRLDASFFNESNPYYHNLWMALDMLTKQDTSSSSETVTVDYQPNTLFEEGEASITPSGTIPQGKTDALLNALLSVNPQDDAVLYHETNGVRDKETFIILQLVAYANGSVCGAGDVIALCPADTQIYSVAQLCQLASFVPEYGAGYGQLIAGVFDDGAFDSAMPLSCSGYGVTSWGIRYKAVSIEYENYTPSFNHNTPYLYDENGDEVAFLAMLSKDTDKTDSITTEEFGTIRSGARITKSMLLGGDITPAAFLLSYCKTFGLYIVKDATSKSVTIRCRNTQFSGEVADINSRIDRDSAMDKEPTIAPSKWLTMGHGVSEGDYAKNYKARYGRDYGSQRIDTGYEFDNEETELLNDSIFKSAVEVLDMAYLFANPVNANGTQKLNFEIGSCELTYYDNSDNTVSREFGGVVPASYQHWNTLLNFADLFPKVQMGDDAFGTLLFFGAKRYTQNTPAYITDDFAMMYTLNEGEPCWLLSRGGTYALSTTSIPQFSRSMRSNDLKTIGLQLEMATPKEIYNDYVSGINESKAIYPQGWRAFITDRYDENTCLVRCRVDLRGVKVSNALLRQFYFFDGAIWVLNKINGYVPDADGPTECEFIKVNDTDAYTQGQTYEGYTPATEYQIQVSPRALEFGASGGTLQITISGDDAWSLSLPHGSEAGGAYDESYDESYDTFSSWVDVSQRVGGTQGVETVTVVNVTLGAYTGTSPRSGIIAVHGASGQVINVSISQAGVVYATTVNPTSLNFASAGGSDTFVVSSNDEWELSVPNGFSASPTSGGTAGTATTTTVTVTAAAAPDGNSGTIQVVGDYSTAQVGLTQGAANYTYELQSISNLSFGAAGGTQGVSVYGVTKRDGVVINTQLLSASDGLSLSKGSGDTYNQLSISGISISASNLGKNTRSALSVTFTASWRGVTKTFTVSQSANSQGGPTIVIGMSIDGDTSSSKTVNFGVQDLKVYGTVTKTYIWSSGATDYETDVPTIAKTVDAYSAWSLQAETGEDYLASLLTTENRNPYARPCTIEASYSGATSKTIVVTQEAYVSPYTSLAFGLAKIGTRTNYNQLLDMSLYESQEIGQEVYYNTSNTDHIGFTVTNNGNYPVELSRTSFSVKFAGFTYQGSMFVGGASVNKVQIAVGATVQVVMGAYNWDAVIGTQRAVQLQLWYDGEMMDNTVINVQ